MSPKLKEVFGVVQSAAKVSIVSGASGFWGNSAENNPRAVPTLSLDTLLVEASSLLSAALGVIEERESVRLLDLLAEEAEKMAVPNRMVTITNRARRGSRFWSCVG
jgi:hypothetical protein